MAASIASTCLWASVDELRPWLGYNQNDTSHDDMLIIRANAVSEEIERETGRIFVTRSITETIDGSGTPYLFLRGYPGVSVTSFTLNGEAVDATTYTLDADAGILKHETATWTKGVGNYAIVYTAGYARESLPASVLTLGVELLRMRYLQWGNNADVYAYQAQGGAGALTPVGDWVSIRKQLESLRYQYRMAVV